MFHERTTEVQEDLDQWAFGGLGMGPNPATLGGRPARWDFAGMWFSALFQRAIARSQSGASIARNLLMEHFGDSSQFIPSIDPGDYIPEMPAEPVPTDPIYAPPPITLDPITWSGGLPTTVAPRPAGYGSYSGPPPQPMTGSWADYEQTSYVPWPDPVTQYQVWANEAWRNDEAARQEKKRNWAYWDSPASRRIGVAAPRFGRRLEPDWWRRLIRVYG